MVPARSPITRTSETTTMIFHPPPPPPLCTGAGAGAFRLLNGESINVCAPYLLGRLAGLPRFNCSVINGAKPPQSDTLTVSTGAGPAAYCATQVKFSSASMLPEPLYAATVG